MRIAIVLISMVPGFLSAQERDIRCEINELRSELMTARCDRILFDREPGQTLSEREGALSLLALTYMQAFATGANRPFAEVGDQWINFCDQFPDAPFTSFR